MSRGGIHIGRLSLFLWSGGWCWFDRMDCGGHCRNWYFGPLGVEWRPKPVDLDCLVAGCRWGDSDSAECECPGRAPVYDATVDLTIPSFQRVSRIDFDECERHPLTVVETRPVTDDGYDW